MRSSAGGTDSLLKIILTYNSNLNGIFTGSKKERLLRVYSSTYWQVQNSPVWQLWWNQGETVFYLEFLFDSCNKIVDSRMSDTTMAKRTSLAYKKLVFLELLQNLEFNIENRKMFRLVLVIQTTTIHLPSATGLIQWHNLKVGEVYRLMLNQ